MDSAAGIQERRRELRRPARFLALVKIGANLYGRGYTRDISINGACLESVSIFKLIRPARAFDLKGLPISLRSTTPSIALQGKVVRVDPSKGETGIAVTVTTDDTLWRNVCTDLSLD
jgi:hypothetical protein